MCGVEGKRRTLRSKRYGFTTNSRHETYTLCVVVNINLCWSYVGRINLYYSLVFPYLIYFNEVWGNASTVHLDPIIKIQNRAIRTITFSSYLSPSVPIFQSLNILIFRKLVIQRVSLLMFKISKCDVPKPLHSLFRTNNSYHNYQTIEE